MLLSPIVSHGDVTGVMIVLNAIERPWTRAETSRARIVAHQLGAVIDGMSSPAQLVPLPQPSAEALGGALLEQ
jgi:signal transduction protein with GAF and PtsI domain